ncbi:hypothetical protein [Aeromonas sp. FDAARGOS 1419]|uniref:hypothetical protein n=1 Tax=Aeromonas sp. FDAARGOS 1419 TaxID=2778068 RepID=UPI001C240683|nr:hypothetical protein [Aeromonas sp. FDAARGOS 1419]QWZ78089.1 hypothetical protein I6L49_03655 [Aeromonas sp. FDAARGOS 1419]
MYRLYFVILCAILGGCGGGGDADKSSSSPSSPSSPSAPSITNRVVSANDIIHSFKVNETASIDLKPFTASSDGATPYLSSLEVLSGDSVCHDAVIDKNGFSLKSDAPASCLIKYTVSDNHGISASAISRTVIRSITNKVASDKIQLSPLSLTVSEYSDGSVDVSNGTLMLTDNIIVVGLGSAQASTADNKILYTAQESGISRIFYEMIDGEGGVYLGSVDVAISQEGNTAPIANNFSYPVAPQVIKAGEEIQIDIKDHISDTDNDSIRLHDIYSFNGIATIASPEDVSNTKIKFKSFTPGTFFITYTISDDRSGFATAIIAVKVDDYYTDITLPDSGAMYMSPLSAYKANLVGFKYQSIIEADIPGANGQFEAAAFSYYAAEGLCDSRGARLPTVDELLDLKRSGKTKGYWPTKRNYWSAIPAAVDTSYYSVNMLDSSDTPSSLLTSEVAYVTCVEVGEPSDYVVTLSLPEEMRVSTKVPYSVYYRNVNAAELRLFDGDVKLANLGMSFFTTALGNGQNDFYAGERVGSYQPEFVLSKPGHPLHGFRVYKNITINGLNWKGLFGRKDTQVGIVTNNPPLPVHVTYEFPSGENIYCGHANQVTALGVSKNKGSFVGSVQWDWDWRVLESNKMKKLIIRLSRYLPTNETVISFFGYEDSNGVSYGCGSLEPKVGNYENHVLHTIPLGLNEKIVKIIVYAKNTTSRDILGVQIFTDN